MLPVASVMPHSFGGRSELLVNACANGSTLQFVLHHQNPASDFSMYRTRHVTHSTGGPLMGSRTSMRAHKVTIRKSRSPHVGPRLATPTKHEMKP